MQKGDFIEIIIEDMSQEGNGIGHADDGMTVFVSGAVVGDRVRVGISNVKKNYAQGKAVNIIEKSVMRRSNEEICPYIDRCGGCGYGKLTYDAQLKLKEKSVRDKFERLAGIDCHSDNIDKNLIKPIIPCINQQGYRNKATISVYKDFVGFKEKKSNMVVDCKECRIQSPKAMAAADAVRDFIKKEHIENVIDSIVVKTTSLEEVMVVLNSIKDKKTGKPIKKDFNWEKLALDIDDATENSLESFYVDDKCIAGKRTILDEAEGVKFEISPLSFYQVNHDQMINLYDKVIEYAEPKEGNVILDLYCGIGTIGLYIANKLCDKCMVYGIESVKPAVIDANRNAVINGIVNARYFTGKAEDILPKLMESDGIDGVKIESCDVAIVDPPRAGCDKVLLDSVAKANPEKIVYVSCDAATLSRDIKYLSEMGYKLIEATPVDMFPDTVHVETVALLSKLDVNKHIYVDITTDELDLTK